MELAHEILKRNGALQFQLSDEVQIDGVDYHYAIIDENTRASRLGIVFVIRISYS